MSITYTTPAPRIPDSPNKDVIPHLRQTEEMLHEELESIAEDAFGKKGSAEDRDRVIELERRLDNVTRTITLVENL